MKGRFRFYLQELLTFSKAEKNSILILSVMILLVILLICLFPLFFHNRDNTYDIREARKQIEEFEKKIASKPSVRNSKVLHKKDPVLELNSTDSTSLEKLPCIGPVTASRILKYRRKLGGYSSVKQLQEIWGMQDSQWKCIKWFFVVNSSKIERVHINTATFKEINAHPYISYEQTKLIFLLRKTGKISELNQLTAVFTREELERVKPYISFE